MAAVTTSMKKMYWIGRNVSSAPASMGVANIVSDWAVDWMPLKRVKCSLGTIWGMSALTAGEWTPCPNPRIAAASSSSQMLFCPERNSSAMISVTAAIEASAILMIRLRL